MPSPKSHLTKMMKKRKKRNKPKMNRLKKKRTMKRRPKKIPVINMLAPAMKNSSNQPKSPSIGLHSAPSWIPPTSDRSGARN